MRSSLVFAAGILVGVAVQGVGTQTRTDTLKLNHIAITVPDLDEGIRFYTRALGVKEAFTFRDDRGTPFSYLQLSRETFLELQPAGTRTPGFLHIGLEVTDLRRSLPAFKAGGLEVSDPRESSRTKALISQASDKNGVRYEFLEFGPGSVQRKAMDDWK